MSNAFVETVLEMILAEEPDENGFRTVVSSSYSKIQGKSVFMHGTDDLCALISDPRVPWLRVRVSDPHHSSSVRSLLGACIENWEFHGHLDFDDRILEALNARFTPAEQALQLASAGALPLKPEFIGGGLDQRHVLLERLGMIVAGSPEMIEAWTDLLFLEYKFRDKLVSKDLFDTFECLQGGTPLYDRLIPDIRTRNRPSMLTLCAVQIIAAAFEPQKVKASMERYTQASLYEISRAELTGYFNEDFNPIRQAFAHGMYLVGDFANEGFVQLHVTKSAIKARDIVVVPALLSVMASCEKPAFSLRSIVGAPKALNKKILGDFITHYLFRWRDDLAERVMESPRNIVLKRALKHESSIAHMFSTAAFRKSYSDEQRGRHVEMFNRLSGDVRQLVIDRLWRELPALLQGKSQSELGGMVQFMLGIPGQPEAMREFVLPKLRKLLMRMEGNEFRHYDFCSAMRKMLDKGVLTSRDVGRAVTSLAVLDRVIDRLRIPRSELIPHISPRVGEQLIAVDLGL